MEVILSWRAMILWGVIVAVAMTGIIYLKDKRKYDKNKADMEDASRLEGDLTEYSDAKVHPFRKFRAPFSGKAEHTFPE